MITCKKKSHRTTGTSTAHYSIKIAPKRLHHTKYTNQHRNTLVCQFLAYETISAAMISEQKQCKDNELTYSSPLRSLHCNT